MAQVKGKDGLSQQQRAELRCCMSCEWIFKKSEAGSTDCPKCGWSSYGAAFVFGNKAYRYAKTQKPWFDKKMSAYAFKLRQEIKEAEQSHATQVIGRGVHNW